MCIYFDEASRTVEIQMHDTALEKRLIKLAATYPGLFQQTDDEEYGNFFLIEIISCSGEVFL